MNNDRVMGRNSVDPRQFGEVKYLSIQCYSDHPEVYRMADLVVASLTDGKVRDHSAKYLKPARKFIASLWLHESDLFRWSTKPEYYGSKRKQVWLTSATLAISQQMMELGYINEVAPAIAPAMAKDGEGKAAIYCKSYKFTKEMISLTFSDVVLDPDLDRITLRDEQDHVLPLPDDVRASGWFKQTVETLNAHSELLTREAITKGNGRPMSPIDKHYFRRFKGSFNTTGRFYSGFINWPKEERLQIRFNHGEPAFSLDLSSLHPYLLLRYFHRSDMYRPESSDVPQDPYDVPEFSHLPRAVHKKAVAILINSLNIEKASRALYNTHYWTDENGELKVKTYDGRQKRRGTKAFPNNKTEALQYIGAFRVSHPLLAKHICSGAGSVLQFIDSNLMLFLLMQTTKARIPVLPVHDEVIFPIGNLRQIIESLTFAVRVTLADGRWPLVEHGFEGVLLNDPSDFGELPIKVSYYLDGEIHEYKHCIDMEHRWWEDDEEINRRMPLHG